VESLQIPFNLLAGGPEVLCAADGNDALGGLRFVEADEVRELMSHKVVPIGALQWLVPNEMRFVPCGKDAHGRSVPFGKRLFTNTGGPLRELADVFSQSPDVAMQAIKRNLGRSSHLDC
jgi:hypothetical protein